MIRRFRQRWRRRLLDWVERRSPRHPGPITLHRRRIYILPTRAGAYFALLLLAMLLGAMNYSNSLAFALTFLLAALALVAMHHTHRNLLNLQVRARRPAAVFAGQVMQVGLILHNPSRAMRWAIKAEHENESADDVPITDVPATEESLLDLRLATRRRGLHTLPALRINTRYPMGLFRAWSWVRLDVAGLVYPKPAGRQPLPPPVSGDTVGTHGTDAGREDFAGLRRYVRGDPPRLIHWKSYPRTGALMVKSFTDPRERECWLDWALVDEQSVEATLSQLTRWVIDAEAAAHTYGLRLPGLAIAPATGIAHRDRCLRALALHEH